MTNMAFLWTSVFYLMLLGLKCVWTWPFQGYWQFLVLYCIVLLMASENCLHWIHTAISFHMGIQELGGKSSGKETYFNSRTVFCLWVDLWTDVKLLGQQYFLVACCEERSELTKLPVWRPIMTYVLSRDATTRCLACFERQDLAGIQVVSFTLGVQLEQPVRSTSSKQVWNDIPVSLLLQ